jgi:hypothetical protein
MFFIMLVCVAFTWNEGAWNNVVTWIMALISGLFATNYYGSMASYFTYTMGWGIPFQEELLVEYTGAANYLWDIISFWFIFAVVFALLRFVADKLCKTKLRFKKPVEIATNITMSFAIAMLMLTFFLFTTHIAPLSRHPFGSAFQYTPQQEGPSRMWMRLADYWSRGIGPLSRLGTVKRFGSSQDFIDRHYWRRRTLEGEDGFIVDMEQAYDEEAN